MSHCTDCNDSILNGQVSLIPDPVCHNNCGTETPCEGIGTYTNCVTMNNALTCIGSISGVTLSSVLTMLDTKLCQVITGKCTVSIDANDTCCGYLGDKLIAGTGVTITKNIATASSGCKTLTISTNPETLVWHDLQLATSYETKSDTYGLYQKPQYSDKDALGRVWFRGSFTKKLGYTLPSAQVEGVLSVALPTTLRPKFVRTSLNGRCNGNVNQTQTLQLHILISGVFSIKNYSNTPFENKGVFTLDGLWIDTNA
jgi:hypothetical protein